MESTSHLIDRAVHNAITIFYNQSTYGEHEIVIQKSRFICWY